MMTDCTNRIVSKTPGTKAAYQARANNLLVMAKREEAAVEGLADLIDWFGAQHNRWAPATIRQYRAALLYGLEMTVTDTIDTTMLAEHLRVGPAARETGPKQTSARKRKSLKREEFTALGDCLQESGHPDDILILGFVAFGAALFLRPIEYLDARIEGSMLVVRNAKATNGRANGSQRERDLTGMETKAIVSLGAFLKRLGEARREAGDWTRLRDRLAARLARVCKKLKIPRVSFYTLRHVGMSTAKSWMTPLEVAAAAGHGSVRTATSHYAKRRTGWVGLKLAGKPSPASIAQVRGEAKFFHRKPPAVSPG